MWWIQYMLGVIILLLFYLYWYQKWSYTAKLLNKFPGDPTPPIIGHPLNFTNKPDVVYKKIEEMLSKYNQTVRIWAANFGSLHIITADDAEILLSNVKYIEKGFIYLLLTNWLQAGLLLSNGNKWLQRRKILTPAFHFNILRRFVPMLQEHCEELVKTLRAECTKPKTNIIPFLTDTTLTAICETAMGTKLNLEDAKQKEYRDALHKLIPHVIWRSLTPWFYIDYIYMFTPYSFIEKRLVSLLHKFTKNVIQDRERNFKDEDVKNLDQDEDDDDVYRKKKRFAMLDLLISAKRNYGEIDSDGIQEEVDTFMFEGHDTTSVGISYILTTIATHPDVQDKIVTELGNIFGDSNRRATYEDLQAMKYTEMCIKEVLRLYPSVPVITRTIREEVQLTHHLAPTDIEVYIHINRIHRDPKHFPDPNKFDPERFSPENSKGRHPYAYIPFSAGPRNCIGQRFAMLELKSIVAAVLRNYRLEAVDYLENLTFVQDLVLRTNAEINVKFLLRNEKLKA